ncbi:hypothetical protein APR41_10745 [Salegentibacter salinarum]|uniref:Uncharacterized protein n=1 Tax=Salegentibacter salinarum TaxID=447422 RepID=A0A2N0TM67_9FLAO|nr:hypothetical protein [Salegentibacter salinarum]PKD15768.1 hypothetical protein APR41_10745 [Salegentibacter salinarum]SKB74261.1 hypothetical protein SAMN05660903_02360 [Salegentibacter salinarum]
MKKIQLLFKKCIQDSQDYGSDNEHMISRIFYEVDGVDYECNVRQPYGESFSFDEDPIEVEAPKELGKKINYGQFRDEVENYYKQIVGSSGRGINIQGGTNIRMQNNTFEMEYRTEIDEAGYSGGW